MKTSANTIVKFKNGISLHFGKNRRIITKKLIFEDNTGFEVTVYSNSGSHFTYKYKLEQPVDIWLLELASTGICDRIRAAITGVKELEKAEKTIAMKFRQYEQKILLTRHNRGDIILNTHQKAFAIYHEMPYLTLEQRFFVQKSYKSLTKEQKINIFKDPNIKLILAELKVKRMQLTESLT